MSFSTRIPYLIYIIILVSAYLGSAVEIPTPTITISPEAGKVLLLGSGGFIGSYLTKELTANGYDILHVYNRTHVDIRNSTAFTAYLENEKISFCLFLACEVGGSKYIGVDNKLAQLDIIQRSRGIPYLFTSSYLQGQDTAYGTIKRLGEQWIDASNAFLSNSTTIAGRGKTVRLWNIYGRERLGLRSHVIIDWIHSCLRNQDIQSRTNGLEARQFLHGTDVARAIVLLMKYFAHADPVTDISSNEWVTLRYVAQVIQDIQQTRQPDRPCTISYTNTTADVRARLSPQYSTMLSETLKWTPTMSFTKGLEDLFDFVETEYIAKQKHSSKEEL